MIATSLDSLAHPPEVVVTFIRRLISEHSDYHGEERRSDVRNSVCIPISVQCLDDLYRPADAAIQTTTLNLSGGGVGFFAEHPITCRFVLVGLTSRNGDRLDIMASIRHCTAAGPRYLIGARFVVRWSEASRHQAEEPAAKPSPQD